MYLIWTAGRTSIVLANRSGSMCKDSRRSTSIDEPVRLVSTGSSVELSRETDQRTNVSDGVLRVEPPVPMALTVVK